MLASRSCSYSDGAAAAAAAATAASRRPGGEGKVWRGPSLREGYKSASPTFFVSAFPGLLLPRKLFGRLGFRFLSKGRAQVPILFGEGTALGLPRAGRRAARMTGGGENLG